MPSLPVAGNELHVERRGDGAPLVLIQGMGAHSGHWSPAFLDELAPGFELILYDHRATGRSVAGPAAAPVSVGSLAEDALALLDALELPSAHVFGFSMGGMVAQELALAAPERIASLTLAATSCGGTQSKPTSPEVVRALTAAVLSGSRERVVKTGFGFLVSAAYAADAEHYPPFAAAASDHPAGLGTLLEHQSAILAHDTFARLREVQVPTLVVHGTEDRLLSAINGDLVASLIPGARIELLDGAGHLLYWEQPARVAQLVREHAGRCAS